MAFVSEGEKPSTTRADTTNGMPATNAMAAGTNDGPVIRATSALTFLNFSIPSPF